MMIPPSADFPTAPPLLPPPPPPSPRSPSLIPEVASPAAPPYILPPPSPGDVSPLPPKMSIDFRVAVVNATSLRTDLRQASLVAYIAEIKSDVVAVSEAYTSTRQVEQWRQQLHRLSDPLSVFAPNTEDGHGILLLLRRRWVPYVEGIDSHGRRGLQLRFRFRGLTLHVLALYYPSGVNNFAATTAATPDGNARAALAGEATALTSWAEQRLVEADRAQARLIVVGDLNGCMDPSRERAFFPHDPNRAPNWRRSTGPENGLLRLLDAAPRLVDPWRRLHPEEPGFTHQQASRTGISRARLDYALVDMDTAVCCRVLVDEEHTGLEDLGLDHHPIILDVDVLPFSVASIGQQPAADVRRVWRVCPSRITTKHWKEFKAATKAEFENGPPAIANEEVDDVVEDLNDKLWRVMRRTLPMRQLGKSPATPSTPSLLFGARRWLAKRTRRARAVLRPNGRRPQDAAAQEAADLAADGILAGFQDRFMLLRTPFGRLREDSGVQNAALLSRLDAALRRWEERRRRDELQGRIADAVSRRFAEFDARPGAHLRRVLDRQQEPLELTIARIEGMLYDDPADVREAVRGFFANLLPETTMSPLDAFPGWAPEYEPAAHVPAGHFDILTTPVAPEEIAEAIRGLGPWKAPGASGIPAGVVRAALPSISLLLANVYSAVLRRGRLPAAWTLALMTPLAKDPVWTGDISRLRPIMLLDVCRKIFFAVATRRVQARLAEQDVLCPWNVGFRTGLHAPDKIAVIKSAADICRLTGRTLQLTSLDIARAYDSVSLSSLKASLHRLRFPPAFISILSQNYLDRQVEVRTAHGYTSAYRPGCGLEQGDTMSPLLWLCFYDALLCRLTASGLGMGVASDSDQLPESRRIEPLTVSAAAMADDLTLVADSAAGMRGLVTLVDEFMLIHGVRVNGGKTVMATQAQRGSADFPTQIEMVSSPDADITDIRDGTGAFRLVGAFLRLDGNPEAAVAQMRRTAGAIAGAIKHKAVNYRIVRYVVRNVMLPSLAYRTWGQAVPLAQLADLEKIWLPVVKRKLGLASSTPTDILRDPAGYNIPSLEAEILQRHVPEVLRRLSHPAPMMRVTEHHLRLVQNTLQLPDFFLATTTPARPLDILRHDYYVWLHSLLARYDLTVRPTRAELAHQPATIAPDLTLMLPPYARDAAARLQALVRDRPDALFAIEEPDMPFRPQPGARVQRGARWARELATAWTELTPTSRRSYLQPRTPATACRKRHFDAMDEPSRPAMPPPPISPAHRLGASVLSVPAHRDLFSARKRRRTANAPPPSPPPLRAPQATPTRRASTPLPHGRHRRRRLTYLPEPGQHPSSTPSRSPSPPSPHPPAHSPVPPTTPSPLPPPSSSEPTIPPPAPRPGRPMAIPCFRLRLHQPPRIPLPPSSIPASTLPLSPTPPPPLYLTRSASHLSTTATTPLPPPPMIPVILLPPDPDPDPDRCTITAPTHFRPSRLPATPAALSTIPPPHHPSSLCPTPPQPRPPPHHHYVCLPPPSLVYAF